MVREGLWEGVTCELKKSLSQARAAPGEEHSRQRAQPVQRPGHRIRLVPTRSVRRATRLLQRKGWGGEEVQLERLSRPDPEARS